MESVEGSKDGPGKGSKDGPGKGSKDEPVRASTEEPVKGSNEEPVKGSIEGPVIEGTEEPSIGLVSPAGTEKRSATEPGNISVSAAGPVKLSDWPGTGPGKGSD